MRSRPARVQDNTWDHAEVYLLSQSRIARNQDDMSAKLATVL